MEPPFTQADFFRVFADYNEAVWPAPWVLGAAAVLATAFAFAKGRSADRGILLVLAVFWAWMGGVYHWMFFAGINPAARLFGFLFVLEGVLLAVEAVRARGLGFEPRPDPYGVAGAILIVYALIVYPLLGTALGHEYPAVPTFGLPCPTTIFTLGILLWARPRVPWWLLVVPVLWSLVGTSAAALFGVLQDLALPVAGVGGGAMIVWRNRRDSGSGSEAATA